MGWWFDIELSYRWVLSDEENIVLLAWCGVKFYFVLMAWIDYPTHYVKVLDNRQVFINSRKVVVLFWNTTTRRKPYYTASDTLSCSFEYYVEIVGNYLYS